MLDITESQESSQSTTPAYPSFDAWEEARYPTRREEALITNLLQYYLKPPAAQNQAQPPNLQPPAAALSQATPKLTTQAAKPSALPAAAPSPLVAPSAAPSPSVAPSATHQPPLEAISSAVPKQRGGRQKARGRPRNSEQANQLQPSNETTLTFFKQAWTDARSNPTQMYFQKALYILMLFQIGPNARKLFIFFLLQ